MGRFGRENAEFLGRRCLIYTSPIYTRPIQTITRSMKLQSHGEHSDEPSIQQRAQSARFQNEEESQLGGRMILTFVPWNSRVVTMDLVGFRPVLADS